MEKLKIMILLAIIQLDIGPMNCTRYRIHEVELRKLRYFACKLIPIRGQIIEIKPSNVDLIIESKEVVEHPRLETRKQW